MQSTELKENVRHNFIAGVLDGAFFGVGLGFTSKEVIMPLFLNTLGASTILIGLVSSLHDIGWYLPQLLMAGRVARLRRYKPMVLRFTLHERWPFFGLAVVAWLVGVVPTEITLALTVIFYGIFSFGGGLSAIAWQSMIGKVMPKSLTGTFFGSQSGAANLLAAAGAVGAGFLLERLVPQAGYALCFLLAGIGMMISMGFLAQTREPDHEVAHDSATTARGWAKFGDILRRDVNFRWLLVGRNVAQFAWMAMAFYTIYAVRHFNMNEQTAGIMAGLLLVSQTVSGPAMGWLGDRFGHRTLFAIGAIMMTVSAGLALVAPSLDWFYVIFALAGASRVALWAVSITLTLEFGASGEKPLYIGLANTLIAPTSILAPIVGGWLADNVGFQATFLMSLICGIITAAVMLFLVRNPQQNAPYIRPIRNPAIVSE
ncbi:MAG: MFS transporter [Anaerolineae bacterium]